MAVIGIMGGTFNPIHMGHIQIAQAAYEQYALDEVWFMPNHIPGYKDRSALVSGEHRMAMVELAVAGIPGFQASDFELRKPGNTYTARTLEQLTKLYPEDLFYFIMGEDSLGYFREWKEPETILKYARILVAPRGEHQESHLGQLLQAENDYFGDTYFYPIACSLVPCSSRELREKLKQGADPCFSYIGDYIPENVLNYIRKHHLYQTK